MMRRCIAVAAVLAVGCTGVLTGPGLPTDGLSLYRQVWADLDRHYALFAVKDINWDSLRAVHEVAARAAASDGQLADAIGALLAELRDVHVDLYTPARVYRYAGFDDRPDFFDFGMVQDYYVRDWRVTDDDRLGYGLLKPDTGYVWIPGFGGAGFGADLDTAIMNLGTPHALVLDIRDNGGGDNRNAMEIASRFVDRKHTYAYVRWRDGPRHDDLGPPRALTVSPASAAFTGPVVVLTNRKVYSAAEDFVLAMRQAPHAIIVGDSTGGGLGNPLVHELANGWTYRFSEWLETAPDGTVAEEAGLAPDVWVRGSAAELAAGRDAILDSAMAILRDVPPSSQPARAFATSSVSRGTISNRSPTIP
jgi:Peptidase family S41